MTQGSSTWVLVRVTGSLLVALVALHLLGSFFLRSWFETFDSPLYRIGRYAVDLAMLIVAITHGLIGLYGVVVEQGISQRARRTAQWSLGALGLVLAYGAFLTLGRLLS